MSLLNNASSGGNGGTGGAGGDTPPANGGGTPPENGGTPPANGGGTPPAGGDGSGSVFSTEGFTAAMKNPEILKDGKLFGIWPSFEEAAKGVSNLQGKLREKSPDAPETYDFSKVQVKDKPDLKVDGESQVAKAMLPAFKEAKLTQEQANVLAGAFLQFEDGLMIDAKAEMTKLGEKGQAMVDNIKQHVLDKAPDDLKKSIEAVTLTADGIKVLNWLLEGRVEGTIPNDSAAGEMSKTSQQWFDEAQEYRTKHKDTLAGDAGQQKRYMELMRKGAEAKQRERKAGK